jgi:hypothetical protein
LKRAGPALFFVASKLAVGGINYKVGGIPAQVGGKNGEVGGIPAQVGGKNTKVGGIS